MYGQYDGVLDIYYGATAKLQNVTLVKNLNLNGTLDGVDTGSTLHMRGTTFNNNGHAKVAVIYFDSAGVQHINGTGSWEQTISLFSIENGTTVILDSNMTFQTRLFTTGGGGVNNLDIGGHKITFAGSVAPDPNPNQLDIDHQLIGTGSLHTQGNAALYVTGTFAPDLFVDSGVTLAHTSIGFDGPIQVAKDAELKTDTSAIIANNNVINNGTISGDGEFRMHGVQFTNSGPITVAKFLLWQYPAPPSFEQHIAGSGQWTGGQVDLSTFSYLAKLDNDVEMRAGVVNIYRLDLQSHTITVDSSGSGGSTVVLFSGVSSVTGAGTFLIKDTVTLQNNSAAGFTVPLIADHGTFSVNGFFNNTVDIRNYSQFNVPDSKILTVGGYFSIDDTSHLHGGGSYTTIELRGDTGYLGQDFDNSMGTTVLNSSNNQQLIQSSDGLTYLYTKNLTVQSKNVSLFLPEVRITGVLELDGALTIVKPPALGWPGGIVLEQTATTTGTGDVFGQVQRNGVFQLNKTYSFGNPNTSLTFKTGSSLPDYVSMVINKSPAEGLPTSINRSYSLVASGGSGWTAMLRLHYSDDELKSMDEHDLLLWNQPGSSDPWVKIATSKSDYFYNWLEPSGGSRTGDWALTAKPHIYLPFIKR